MEREQIIKALECCRYGGRCDECPCFEIPNCQALANNNALTLITSQEQRIKELGEEVESLKQCMEHEHASFMETFGEYGEKCERLTEEYERLKLEYAGFEAGAKDVISFVKSDTVRKMQERLTLEFDRMHKNNFMTPEVRQWILYQIAKEMVGDTK